MDTDWNGDVVIDTPALIRRSSMMQISLGELIPFLEAIFYNSASVASGIKEIK